LIHVKEAIIVEGKYDKIKLSSVVDGLIIQTNGFRIFKNREQMAMLRRIADSRGLVILTDSDSAGFLIRHYLMGSIPPEKIKNAYIPDIAGKEKRKPKPSKEGKLGVEGVPAGVIVEALKHAGVAVEGVSKPSGRQITKADLYYLGLSGGQQSARKRKTLLRRLGLPEYLSTNSMPQVLNSVISYEELVKAVSDMQGVQ
jgi:ribonuclease M5